MALQSFCLFVLVEWCYCRVGVKPEPDADLAEENLEVKEKKHLHVAASLMEN